MRTDIFGHATPTYVQPHPPGDSSERSFSAPNQA